MPFKRDTKLYNAVNADAFRREAKRLTRWWTSDRSFLMKIANVLDGHGGITSFFSGIQIEKDCIVLGSTTTQYWGLVASVCETVPGLRAAPLDFEFFGISLPSQP